MSIGLKIDIENRKIIMSRAFAKHFADTSSEEYAQVQNVRRDYPTFSVVTKKINTNPKKKVYKGLTYDYMRRYITLHTLPEERHSTMREFDELIIISKCQKKSLRYPTIKKWFLNKYPEIEKFGMEDLPNEEAA